MINTASDYQKAKLRKKIKSAQATDGAMTTIPSPEECEKQLRKYLKHENVGLSHGLKAPYNAEKNALIWDTTTGLYHCIWEWREYGAELTVIWRDTGKVSIHGYYNLLWRRWFR